MSVMTKKGAREVTRTLDRLANLFQAEHKTLGVPVKIAQDFAFRCDLLSDQIEKVAGISKAALSELDVVKEKGFNPEEIGEEVGGPQEGDADEKPYMSGEFTQQENRELREMQEDGDLGSTVNEEPQAPQSGKQASFEHIGRQEINHRLGMAAAKLQGFATRLASAGQKDLAAATSKFASSVMDTQMAVLNGTIDAGQATRVLQAAGHVLPHVASVDAKTAAKVGQMLALAGKVAGCEKLPEGGMRDNCEKKKEEGAKNKDEDKGDEKKDEPEDKPEAAKKASHGFKLDA